MSDEDHLAAILKSWGQFPAPTDADFNCLLQEVLTALHDGADRETLEAVIQNEFCNHHGTYGPAEEVMNVAHTISEWWSAKQLNS